jgi:hypothetical protein
MRKLNEQNEEEAEAVCEPMQSSDDGLETASSTVTPMFPNA